MNKKLKKSKKSKKLIRSLKELNLFLEHVEWTEEIKAFVYNEVIPLLRSKSPMADAVFTKEFPTLIKSLEEEQQMLHAQIVEESKELRCLKDEHRILKKELKNRKYFCEKFCPVTIKESEDFRLFSLETFVDLLKNEIALMQNCSIEVEEVIKGIMMERAYVTCSLHEVLCDLGLISEKLQKIFVVYSNQIKNYLFEKERELLKRVKDIEVRIEKFLSEGYHQDDKSPDKIKAQIDKNCIEFLLRNRGLIISLANKILGVGSYEWQDVEAIAAEAFYLSLGHRNPYKGTKLTSVFYFYFKKLLFEQPMDTFALGKDIYDNQNQHEGESETSSILNVTAFGDIKSETFSLRSKEHYTIICDSFKKVAPNRLMNALEYLSSSVPYEGLKIKLCKIYKSDNLHLVLQQIRGDIIELHRNGWQIFKAECVNNSSYYKLLICAKSSHGAKEYLKEYGELINLTPFCRD